jgi:Glycosyltransferase WbsX
MGKAIFQTIPTNKNRAITLQEQYFDPTEDMVQEHYQWLSQFFRHPNYIKINNQPVMMLYYYDARAIPILKELRMFAKQDGFDGIYWIVGRSAYPDGLYDP